MESKNAVLEQFDREYLKRGIQYIIKIRYGLSLVFLLASLATFGKPDTIFYLIGTALYFSFNLFLVFSLKKRNEIPKQWVYNVIYLDLIIITVFYYLGIITNAPNDSSRPVYESIFYCIYIFLAIYSGFLYSAKFVTIIGGLSSIVYGISIPLAIKWGSPYILDNKIMITDRNTIDLSVEIKKILFLFTMIFCYNFVVRLLKSMQVDLKKMLLELEDKVIERTQELNETLKQVKKLKEHQDGDYFLNKLLIEPLAKNQSSSETVKIESLVKQKKTFQFRNKEHELGGDINISDNIKLEGKNYIVFLNGDAMGKSIQGAGGVLVLGTIFKSILQRSISIPIARNVYPERWLKNAFIEMHKAFESFDGSMLMSAVFGLIDEQTGTMYFINSEHPDIVLYRDGVVSFIENRILYRKLGSPIQQGNISVQIFSLKTNDIIFLGSDGRDDIILGTDSHNNHVINDDEKLFLSYIESAEGDINKAYQILLKTGNLMDDLSLMKIRFLGMNADHEKLETKLNLFEDHKEKNRLNDCIEIGEEVINHYPHLTNFIYDLSLVYYETGNFKKAIDLGERIRLRESNNIPNLIALIKSYRAAGKTKRATAILDACLKARPDDERLKKLK